MQRLLYLATMLPGLALIAEIARKMAKLLRDAQDNDPFTVGTARELTAVLSILKNGHARAIRFSTLTAICDALDCTPGELLTLEDGSPPR